MQRIQSQTVMALQRRGARAQQFLGAAQIVVAPIVCELRAPLQYPLLGFAHRLRLLQLVVTQVGKRPPVRPSASHDAAAHFALLLPTCDEVHSAWFARNVFTEWDYLLGIFFRLVPVHRVGPAPQLSRQCNFREGSNEGYEDDGQAPVVGHLRKEEAPPSIELE